ncbi:hypothetical protein NECAME_16236 [Necator americanus]|uniref:Microcystin LR degradation protein MlrC N-terminal domain-containing protein n=1 Tax=Necator americanus TaxID=51031 RepID=W2TX26_NECAM|nr:hypothetical protein NECAME_16236 [Necator americanus]ETN86635.1 hypothetical protein NECAME_16236 [Necator americanus]
MKVLVAGYKHETNTFALDKADWSAFEKGEAFPAPVRGQQMLETMDAVAMPATGFLHYARSKGWSIVPSLWCGAVPSSYVTEDAFERICDEICNDVKAGGFDAVYLDLHGAGVAENEDDTEGELIGRVRQLVGEKMPIVVSLDLHANVTERMLRSADGMVSFRTYPHVDYVETGELAAELLSRRMAHGRRETGPKMTGFVAGLGPSACVETGGVLVVVASGKIGAQDRELFRFVGVHPEQMKIIVVKSSNHFRADFVPLVENEQTDVVIAKARGAAAADPGDLPWRKLPDSIRRRP